MTEEEISNIKIMTNYFPDYCIDLDKITSDNLYKEVRKCTVCLYYKEYMHDYSNISGLLQRLHILKFWMSNGINKDSISDFMTNPGLWISRH